MNLVENVFEIANSFMKNSKYVFINDEAIEEVAELMKENGPSKFPAKETDDIYKTCLLELVGNSINYCYWYGRHDIRPNNASSTEMYSLLEKAFEGYIRPGKFRLRGFEKYLDDFINLLSLSRFPLLEERINHLEQLIPLGESFIAYLVENHEDHTFETTFDTFVCSFPGYASDIFLKRASLFFLQLYRNFGWFEKIMNEIHVPADYQIPKILQHHNCIDYHQSLYNDIFNSQLIPKHSKQECEIRAATILVCQKLSKLTGWNTADVDGWLWLQRKRPMFPFHLTITTDY